MYCKITSIVAIAVIAFGCSSNSTNTVKTNTQHTACYYSNSSIKEQSESIYQKAVQIIKRTNNNFDCEANKLFIDSAFLGNPSALLKLCLMNLPNASPDAYIEKGYAWCLMGLNIVKGIEHNKESKFRSTLLKYEGVISPKQKKIALRAAEAIGRKMICK